MSWFLGYIGPNPVAFSNTIPEKLGSVNSYFENDLCIAFQAGENCYHNLNQPATNRKKFLICGTGITQGGKKKFLDITGWQELLDNGSGITQINGHFAGVVTSSAELNLITDPVGLRDIYCADYGRDGIIFSSSIDKLLKYVKAELDFGIFGSRWLLYNQLSHKSIFKNISRIVGGSKLIVDRRTLNPVFEYFNWLPEVKDREYTAEEFENELISFINVEGESKRTGLLMLSGGLDSRLILSVMQNNFTSPFSVCTFGNNSHPDLRIAKKIATHFWLANITIDQNDYVPERFWDELKSYTTRTVVNNSVTSFLHFKSYDALSGLKDVVIDGGFGEIWRREFLFKLSLWGKNDVISRNPKRILPYLKLHRTEIFDHSLVDEMEKGCLNQIDGFFELLPAPGLIGVENWLDLLAIKTRLPNYYLHELTLHDSLMTSLMPFTQTSLLSNIFRLGLNERKNGRLFRQIIMKNNPKFSRFPLVKGEVVLSFNSTSYQARLVSLLLKKFGAGQNIRKEKINSLKKYSSLIIDLLNDSNVVNTGIYNKKKLQDFKLLAEVNRGDHNLWNEIDWWLAFESFRQSINLE